VLSQARPGFGSPVLSSIIAPVGATTKIPEGLHRVTVAFPAANKLYRFESPNASIVRMFDPDGIEVQAVGNSFEPLVAGTYELFVQSRADSSSERPSLVVGTEREPVREQEYTLGQKVSLDLINGETLLLRFTKTSTGWLNIRAEAEQSIYDSARNPASSYTAIGKYLVGLRNPSGYQPEAVITIDKPAKKAVAKKVAAKKAR
jgi:hypothetical protein